MKQLKKYCPFNKTQWLILASLAVIGMLFFLNGKPYRAEWKNQPSPVQLNFLQSGEYTLEITYEDSPEGNYIRVWADEMVDSHNRMGIVMLEQEINEGSGVVLLSLKLDTPTYGVCVGTLFDSEDEEYLTRVLIQSNHLIYKDHYALGVIVILAGVLLAFWFRQMNRAAEAVGMQAAQKMFRGAPKQYVMPLVLAGLGLLASLPLFSEAILWGDDTAFHLVRLEGIYQGMRTGDFPVRITPQQMAGYGSLTASMYPQLFLYPVAILRFMGVSLMLSYKILLVLINIATAFGAYYAAVNICDSQKVGMWMSILYTFSAYRLSNMYVRGALGETLAMVFLPLVIWGVYEVLWGKGRWLVLVFAMTGILESHVLSTQLCAWFMGAELIFWLCCRKKRQFGKRVWNGCKAVMVTVLLNASFLVPFLYFCGEDFQCFDMPFEVSEHTAYFSQLFALFLPVEGKSLGAGTTQNEMPIAIGGILLAGVLLFLYLLEKTDDRQKIKAVGVHCFVYGGIALVMSSWLFPWERVGQSEGLCRIFTPMQFSWRFLGPATVCWSLTAAIGIVGIAEKRFGRNLLQRVGEEAVRKAEFVKGKNAVKVNIYGVIAVLVMVSTGYFFDHLAQNREQCADKMALEGMSDGDGMYLYRDSERFRPIQLDYHRNEARIGTDIGGGMEYDDYRKEGSHIHVEVTPVGKGADVLLFPFYWFPGYEITVNGEKVSVFSQDTLVACEAPTEKSVIEVRYEGFLFFRLADIVTLVTFFGILAGMRHVGKCEGKGWV